jgi:oxygen-dependent protoporphyrinogen oxidase
MRMSERFDEGRAATISEDARAPVVVVVGAGISGLAAARRLTECLPEARVLVLVLEAAGRAGGVLRTVRRDGLLIEESADSFLTAEPYALDLCRRLGIEDQLIPTDAAHRRAFVVSRDRLVPIPDGLMVMAPTRLWPMLTTPILGPWGKLRMGLERLVPRRGSADESLAAFARRRFGSEAYERLIQPLVGGMYTGDPERLSLRATMPRFQEMERTHGSLIRAALRERKARGKQVPRTGGSGARYGLFVSLSDGMTGLTDVLARSLPAGSIHCGMTVHDLERGRDGRWIIRAGGETSSTTFEADSLIVATPVAEAGRLLSRVDAHLSRLLGRISSTSCAIVTLAYRREQIAHALDGFGFVVPKRENRQILSASFSSVKFPGRAPAGVVLLRAFLGGAFRPEILERDDHGLVDIAAGELSHLLGITGPPLLRHLSRWPAVMPQYEIGHTDLVESIEARIADLPGLALAGNAYHGVGVPHCIQSGERAAESVLNALISGRGVKA